MTTLKKKGSDGTVSICDSIAFDVADSSASTQVMGHVSSPSLLTRTADNVVTRTAGMDSSHPTRDKRRRNSKRVAGQSEAIDYHPASASSRISPRSGASESDHASSSTRNRVIRETPSPLSQSGVQSDESMSDRGAESMAQYVDTPTFSGRAADSPIEREPHQKKGQRYEDQDIEEPRPWRLGEPYYRCGEPGGNVLPGHPAQLVVHPSWYRGTNPTCSRHTKLSRIHATGNDATWCHQCVDDLSSTHCNAGNG